MVNPRENLLRPVKEQEFGAQELAKLAIGDSISYAYNAHLGLRGVKNVLEILEGERGDRLARIVLATYVGHEAAAICEGVAPEYDLRIISRSNLGSINITSEGELRDAMISEAKGFLALSKSEQQAYRERFAENY